MQKPSSFRPALSLLSACLLAINATHSLAQSPAPAPAVKPASPAANSNWQSAFAQGNQAFKAGDYDNAIIHFDAAFTRASATGSPSATLTYNRAVTLYRLKRYTEASDAFSLLLVPGDPSPEQQQWADLARYNLGLIARDTGDFINARKWFEQLQKPNTNPRLQTLVETQLASLKPAITASSSLAGRRAAPAKSSVLLSLGLISDDNASGLADELASRLSSAEDTYVNALAYGHYYVDGSRGRGTKAYGLAQVRRYQDFDSFDSQVVGVGINYETTPSRWTFEAGGRLLQTHVDGRRLSDQYSLITRAATRANEGVLELTHSSSYVDASTYYRYIGGWQHQVKAAWHRRLNNITITPALSWETNSRRDRQFGEQFYSYSPTITAASIALRWDASAQWRVYSQLERSHADYDGSNRHRDLGGAEKNQQRSYQRTQALVGAGYRFADRWQLKGEYIHTDSNDNFQLYSFDKNVLSLKLDYGW